MPELPEVETIVKDLSTSSIINQTIIDVKLLHSSFIKDDQFFQKILNFKLLNITRRGKYLLFHLSGNFKLIIHLGMTGHLFLKDAQSTIEKHEHLHIVFKNQKKLVFYDPRRFGKIKLTDDLDKFFAKIGPEPLDKNFTLETFKKALSSKKKSIKTALLDQSFIAGIGNIYANEALWIAKIHPQKLAKDLTAKEAALLRRSIIEVLQKAIKNKGTSLGLHKSNFSNLNEEKGQNQNFLLVHQKENKQCPKCQTIIIKISIAQRSSFICPNCQKL